MEKNVLEVQMSPKLEAALVEMSRTIAESRRETDRALAESRAETEKSHRELDAKLEKMAAEADKRSREAEKRGRDEDERIAELRASIKELKESVHELGEFYGGVSKNIGFHAEEFFQNALKKTKSFAGIKFKEFEPNLAYSGQKNCEFDVALINPDSIAIIETKNRVHHKFVEELATEKVAQFKKFSKKYGNLHIYLGVAGFSFDPEVLAEAKKYGVGVIRQVGNCARVDKGRLKVY